MTVECEKKYIGDFFPEQANPFYKGLLLSPAFTLEADGIRHNEFQQTLIVKSCRSTGTNPNITEILWNHPETGIEAELEYKYFSNSNVLEIEGRIFNCGNEAVKNIKGPFSLYFETETTDIGTPKMTSVYGGHSTNGAFPPKAYNISKTDGLNNMVGGREGGRSTETEMPYVILTDPEEKYGMFYTLEWPCRWISCPGEIIRGKKRFLQTLMHVAYTGYDLQPGESVYMPKVNLGFFSGNAIAGSNALRKHIVENVRRPIRGGSMLPPVFYNHYYGMGGKPGDFDADRLKQEADVYAELGIEYFVVDAGWFKDGFRDGIGNWEIEEKAAFPDGMEKFSDYIRSKGIKFGFWLEPEFAIKNSDWAKRHPDWFYQANGQRDYHYGKKEFDDCLLKVDNPEVRRQVLDILVGLVEKYKAEWIRWDFNDVPAPFWEANEKANEWGKKQLEYGEGLFLLLDEFMERCPQVHLEACAGGGHRMDMGTLRRAHSAWMNDNSHSYNVIRRFQSGVNRVQPGNYANSAFIWGTYDPYALEKNGCPAAVLRSRMGGSLGFSEETRFMTNEIKQYLKGEIEKYKAQRHLLMKDYYPLFNPQSLEDYDGWQFHDPESGEGFIMLFRMESPNEKIKVRLPGLNKSRVYEFKNADTGDKILLRGDNSIEITIEEKNGTAWFQYSSCKVNRKTYLSKRT